MSSIPTTKPQLLAAINQAFDKMMADYQSIPDAISRDIGVEGNIKGTQVSVADTVAYLIGWGQLVLKWHDREAQGLEIDFPETGYKWNQLGSLAEHFHRQYSDWAYSDLLYEFECTTQALLDLIESKTEHQLYHQPWYQQWTMGRMIQFNTSSPMKNVRTKVRRFKRQCLTKQ